MQLTLVSVTAILAVALGVAAQAQEPSGIPDEMPAECKAACTPLTTRMETTCPGLDDSDAILGCMCGAETGAAMSDCVTCLATLDVKIGQYAIDSINDLCVMSEAPGYTNLTMPSAASGSASASATSQADGTTKTATGTAPNNTASTPEATSSPPPSGAGKLTIGGAGLLVVGGLALLA